MASYEVNGDAVARAEQLIDARQYVLDSDWGDVQPTAEQQNTFLRSHSWAEYAAWHLGLTAGANEETKARHAFVYGDFRRVHRSGLIACIYRAAEWRHKSVERAAYDLLQRLDDRAGITLTHPTAGESPARRAAGSGPTTAWASVGKRSARLSFPTERTAPPRSAAATPRPRL